jgi:hypothetical protein
MFYIRLEIKTPDRGWCGIFRNVDYFIEQSWPHFYEEFMTNKNILHEKHLPPQKEGNFDVEITDELRFAFTTKVFEDKEMTKAIRNLSRLPFIRLLILKEKEVDVIWKGLSLLQVCYYKKEVIRNVQQI